MVLVQPPTTGNRRARHAVVLAQVQHIQNVRSQTFLELLHDARVEDANRGPVPYELWPHLVKIVGLLVGLASLVILKARRLGISWLLAAYAVHVAQRRPGNHVLILSKSQKDSDEVMRHAQYVWANLPSTRRLPVKRMNSSTMEFNFGGRITALPSTEDAGRGMDATLIIADEAAFHVWAAKNYQAYKHALDGGGQLIMVSTSAGPSGLFYDVYQKAKAGINGLIPIFIPWWSRPHRALHDENGGLVFDQSGDLLPNWDWYEKDKAAFDGVAAEFIQEMPSNEREAWTAGQGLVFGQDEDGISIYDSSPHPHGNLSIDAGGFGYDPCKWEDCTWHYAAIDWGGGDPTAVNVYGVTSSGRIHQYGEYHGTGAVPVATLSEYLLEWDPDQVLFDAILCGKDEPNSIAELIWHGWPSESVHAANTDRKEGLRTARRMMKQRRITINPATCKKTIAEFDSYYWDRRRDMRTGEMYHTKTPSDHHGDHADCLRYVCMEIERKELMAMGELPAYEVAH